MNLHNLKLDLSLLILIRLEFALHTLKFPTQKKKKRYSKYCTNEFTFHVNLLPGEVNQF